MPPLRARAPVHSPLGPCCHSPPQTHPSPPHDMLGASLRLPRTHGPLALPKRPNALSPTLSQLDRKREWEMLCRVKPDVIRDKETERNLQRIATR